MRISQQVIGESSENVEEYVDFLLRGDESFEKLEEFYYACNHCGQVYCGNPMSMPDTCVQCKRLFSFEMTAPLTSFRDNITKRWKRIQRRREKYEG